MGPGPDRRRRRVAAALLAAAALVAALAAWGARDGPLTARAEGHARGVAASAAASYVTLRTLNAFLSTAQEVQVEGSVFVASGAVQPLKGLEPIDDSVERIAGVVFAVMLVSGVLAVSVGPLGALGFAMLAAALAIRAGAVAAGRAGASRGLARGLGVYGGVLALAVPLALAGAGLLGDRLTAATRAEHTAIIDEIVGAVDAAAPEAGSGGREMLARIERFQALAANVTARADDLIGSFLTLLAVFLFELAVLPAALLGGCLVAARAAARG